MKKKTAKKQEKKVATIVDTQTAWKNLSNLRGECFLFQLSHKFKGCDYVIEATYQNEVFVFKSDKKGNIESWSILTTKPIEEEGYEIK